MPNFDFLTELGEGSRQEAVGSSDSPSADLNTTPFSQLATRNEDEDSPWGIIISFLFHFIVLITLALVPIYHKTSMFPGISLVATLDSSEESMVPEDDFGV